jgi:general secretion pathway protein D
VSNFNKLTSSVVAVCLFLSGIPLQARTKQGDKLLKQAQKAEAQQNWDSAVDLYDQALATDPNDANYQLLNQQIHSKVAALRIANGRELQKEQKLDAALLQFQKAYLADPGSQIALQEIRATTAMLKERAKVPANTPVLTPAERARQEIERRIDSLTGPPTLRPINAQISSLKVNNQPARVLYESVCKLAGINLIVDPAGLESPGAAGKSFNLDLANVTLQEALNYVALTTHTFWKPISHNAIFVTQEGEQKRQEYQDEIVKVFYVQNASTPNEFTEIFNGVRTGAKLTSNVFQVASQNAIIARGSPDTISLVEKLVHDLDRPKPEVTLDIVIMEVNKSHVTNIGAALLGQGGLTVPLNFTPRNSTPASQIPGSSGTGTTPTTTGTTGTTGTSTGQVTISQLGRLSSADFSTTLPSTVVNALLSDSSTKVLQRPQLRSIDGGKASLKIGQKIPYVSGSLNSAVATPGAIPYATTQFQQLEIGTLVDLQPHVNGYQDISMHIRVEVSNNPNNISIAGISEPIVGQQVDEADVRMRDGEVSILGGLSEKDRNNTLAGVPGFTNIPLLSYLFGNKTVTNTDNETLIAVIPHITRAPELGDIASQGVYAGTERVARVERAPQSTAVNLPTSVPQQRVPVPPVSPNPPRGNGQLPPITSAPPLAEPQLIIPSAAPAPPPVQTSSSPPQSNPEK